MPTALVYSSATSERILSIGIIPLTPSPAHDVIYSTHEGLFRVTGVSTSVGIPVASTSLPLGEVIGWFCPLSAASCLAADTTNERVVRMDQNLGTGGYDITGSLSLNQLQFAQPGHGSSFLACTESARCDSIVEVQL